MARETLRGLHDGVRIRVRRSETRRSDKGTVSGEPRMGKGRKVVDYRSDRNGGLYTVEAERVAIIRKPGLPVRAPIKGAGSHVT